MAQQCFVHLIEKNGVDMTSRDEGALLAARKKGL